MLPRQIEVEGNIWDTEKILDLTERVGQRAMVGFSDFSPQENEAFNKYFALQVITSPLGTQHESRLVIRRDRAIFLVYKMELGVPALILDQSGQLIDPSLGEVVTEVDNQPSLRLHFNPRQIIHPDEQTPEFLGQLSERLDRFQKQLQEDELLLHPDLEARKRSIEGRSIAMQMYDTADINPAPYIFMFDPKLLLGRGIISVVEG